MLFRNELFEQRPCIKRKLPGGMNTYSVEKVLGSGKVLQRIFSYLLQFKFLLHGGFKFRFQFFFFFKSLLFHLSSPETNRHTTLSTKRTVTQHCQPNEPSHNTVNLTNGHTTLLTKRCQYIASPLRSTPEKQKSYYYVIRMEFLGSNFSHVFNLQCWIWYDLVDIVCFSNPGCTFSCFQLNEAKA